MLHAIVNARSGLYALVHWINWFAPIFVVFRRASFRMEEAQMGSPPLSFLSRPRTNWQVSVRDAPGHLCGGITMNKQRRSRPRPVVGEGGFDA
jgi:hypothetical protein